ncbi:unnamed protein product [Rhizophagus irregularis]|nr:unnamed protein product [Rhizophagus irregularis]
MNDHKPTTFLTSCGASAFKIYTNKQRKEETFENGVNTPFPTLKKQHKLKAKNTPNKKSGNTGQNSNSNQPKKKDTKSLTKHAKDDNKLKNLISQKKAKNSSKSKGRNKGNDKVLAEILNLLRK